MKLDYAAQVSELEKIARLAPRPIQLRAPPELLPAKPTVLCLVCSAPRARACGACASVSYCGVEHQAADARFHDPVCDALRDIAEDHRSRVSQRELLAELLTVTPRDVRELAGFEELFGALPPARLRQLSDLATRPLTLAHMLRALDLAGSLNVHVMAAAQRELDVPPEVWAMAQRFLPIGTHLGLTLIGPELRAGRPRTCKALYSRALWPELGKPDLVIGYDCGLLMYPTWKATILDLRGSGVPFVITSFRDWEAEAEARLLTAVRASCLFAPAANRWATRAGRRSSTIANDVSFDNAFVSAWL